MIIGMLLFCAFYKLYLIRFWGSSKRDWLSRWMALFVDYVIWGANGSSNLPSK